jgi:hypothetical protein
MDQNNHIRSETCATFKNTLLISSQKAVATHHPSQLFELLTTFNALVVLIPRFSTSRTFSFGFRRGYESIITGCKCRYDRLEESGNLSHRVVGNESRNRILTFSD